MLAGGRMRAVCAACGACLLPPAARGCNLILSKAKQSTVGRGPCLLGCTATQALGCQQFLGGWDVVGRRQARCWCGVRWYACGVAHWREGSPRPPPAPPSISHPRRLVGRLRPGCKPQDVHCPGGGLHGCAPQPRDGRGAARCLSKPQTAAAGGFSCSSNHCDPVAGPNPRVWLCSSTNCARQTSFLKKMLQE